MAKGGKMMLFGGVASLLVVGIIVGTIVGVTKNKHSSSDSDNGGNNNSQLSSSSKAVDAICAPTDYKEACAQSLSSAAQNQSASPTDLVQAAILYTVQEFKKVMDQASSVKANDNLNKMAVEDCQEMLKDAVDELQASFSMVGDPSLHNDTDREAELNNFLSAVMSYQETCLDQFNSTELRAAMSKVFGDTPKLSENALAMVTAFNNILKAFNIPVNIPTDFSKRLLSEDGYPTWMSGADRKLLSEQANPKPNAIVAKDGSGQFTTIGAALAKIPPKNKERYVIHVKAGVYNEIVTVEKNAEQVFMYGDGPTKTIVTGDRSNVKGFTTSKTATFTAIGLGFIAKDMGFRNTAGADEHQAVAVRVTSDRSAFYNCRFEGYQDTLYAHQHRTFFRDCFISGTVDFIFGMGSTVIQNSEIHINKPLENQQNTVTAHGRISARENTGLVLQNCRFTKEPQTNPTYLGRPWKEYSRAIIMESDLANTISPEGWLPWAGNFALDTCYFAEYNNKGSVTDKRVKWKGFHLLTNKNDVQQFAAGPFLQGDTWLPQTTGPFYLGMAH